jgi:hypothetical protein
VNRTVRIKAEQIARFVVNSVPLTRIAVEMGMSYDGIVRICRTREYLEIEEEVRGKLLGQMDAKLSKRADLRASMAEEMEDEAVPEAWKIVLDNLRKRRDLKTALEILDRDPKRQFARGAAGAGAGAQAQAANPEAVRPAIDSVALAQAVREADVTHTLIKQAEQIKKNEVKPAEA